MPTMTLRANQPQALLAAILDAVEPFGARAAVMAAIANAATAPDQTADVHIDEVANWAQHGWQLAPETK